MAAMTISSGTSTRIDYTVYFPEGNDVRIENKFGNIYTTDHKGKLDITLSNGDMKAHNLDGPTRIKLEFGNANIDKIVNANVTLGYAEFNLENAGELTFESRSSKIYLTSVDNLHMDSKRDKFYVKTAGEVTGDSFFSYLNLDKVTSKINLKTNYGEIKLLAVSDNFTRLDLSSDCTDINIYIDENHLFEFDITRDDRSQVLATASLISKKEEPVIGMEKTFHSTITAGKADRPKVPMLINIKSGKIFLL